ncbi:uncharacterized protein METZ01_LOCUS394608 [marine metagenome]|uniref:Uncharacterized protein n=1 Tax=marine metagenome TaxID=408172 RepID=A0A382V5I5_9ZZZZ
MLVFAVDRMFIRKNFITDGLESRAFRTGS